MKTIFLVLALCLALGQVALAEDMSANDSQLSTAADAALLAPPGHGGSQGHPVVAPRPGPKPGPRPGPGPRPQPRPGPRPGPRPPVWRPYNGYRPGWSWNFGRIPGWWLPRFLVPWVWLNTIYPGYWQCTAINNQGAAFSAIGPDQTQAAYGAVASCQATPGGASQGCYIPPGYCRIR